MPVVKLIIKTSAQMPRMIAPMTTPDRVRARQMLRQAIVVSIDWWLFRLVFFWVSTRLTYASRIAEIGCKRRIFSQGYSATKLVM